MLQEEPSRLQKAASQSPCDKQFQATSSSPAKASASKAPSNRDQQNELLSAHRSSSANTFTDTSANTISRSFYIMPPAKRFKYG